MASPLLHHSIPLLSCVMLPLVFLGELFIPLSSAVQRWWRHRWLRRGAWCRCASIERGMCGNADVAIVGVDQGLLEEERVS
jgi:hypothetical protein